MADRSAEEPRAGARIRRLRRARGMSQAALADALGVSASYLNLIEHNRRKLTVALMLRIAELFGVGAESLAEGDEGQLFADVMDVLGDDLFEEIDLTNTDARELVTATPNAARALLQLYDAWRKARADLRSLAAQSAGAEAESGPFVLAALAPADQISDMIQERSNHFDDLEREAARLAAEMTPGRGDSASPPDRAALVDWLHRAQGVEVAVEPVGSDFPHLRQFDAERRVLRLSERLSPKSALFQIAHQAALLAARPVIDMLLAEGRIRDAGAQALGRVALANYLAGALLMPYDRFLASVREARYDIELLENRFNATFEQVCHRLTTLNRPGAAGVPLHMLRVDVAGNISKRFTLSGLPIPRRGEACARWNVYAAFQRPGVIQAQISELPDGTRYFCLARTVRKGGASHGPAPRYLAIGLGCELRHAAQMVYADGMELGPRADARPIGVNCRICDRMDCAERAQPPVHIRAPIDENLRGASPFTPAEAGVRIRPEPLPTR